MKPTPGVRQLPRGVRRWNKLWPIQDRPCDCRPNVRCRLPLSSLLWLTQSADFTYPTNTFWR